MTPIAAEVSLIKSALDGVWTEESKKAICFRIWHEHCRVGAILAPELFFKTANPNQYNSRHKLLEWLNEFVRRSGYENAHLGLTSSDVSDNARLLQVETSCLMIHNAMNKLRDLASEKQVIRPAMTHFTIAGSTGTFTNILPYLSFDDYKVRPKRLGGIIGQRREFPAKLLFIDDYFDWGRVGFSNGKGPVDSRRQSTGGIQEYRCVSELVLLSGNLIQLCKMVRYMHGIGAVNVKDNTFSSSAPGKTNPTDFETAESMLYTIPGCLLSLHRCISDDLFEGTLNRNWATDHELERAFKVTIKAIHKIVEALERCEFISNSSQADRVTKSENLTLEVINGIPRPIAYNDLADVDKATR